MADEYIRKQDAVERMADVIINEFDVGITYAYTLAEDGLNLPPADVAPVVHGEWLNAIFDSKRYRCSICNYHISNLVRENYCPNCGAKMDA